MKLTITTLVIVESLLITTTKSNGKYKQKFQHLPQNYKHNSWTNTWKNPLTGPIPMTKKHSKNNYSDKTITRTIKK